jgi:hypothetical protein
MDLSIAALVVAVGMGSLQSRPAVGSVRELPLAVSLAASPRPDPLLLGLSARACPVPSCAAVRPNVPPGFALPWLTADEIAQAFARRFDDNAVATAALWLATSRIKVNVRSDRVYLAIRLGGS